MGAPDAVAPLWLAGPDDPGLPAAEVHLWRARLDLPPARLRELWEALAADERGRAQRFRFQRDRDRFVAARGLLREVLARYLSVEPAALRFACSVTGKPALAPAEVPLRFNAAHSGDLALFAVTRGQECGVDLEHVRPGFPALEVARRFFSPAEVAALQALPTGERQQAFFCYWTCKEAYLKARGEGLSGRLDRITGWPLPPQGAPTPFPSDDPAAGWSLLRLIPGPEYVGALVVEGHTWRTRYLELAACTSP